MTADIDRLVRLRHEISTYLAIPVAQRTKYDAPIIRAEDHAALLDVVFFLLDMPGAAL